MNELIAKIEQWAEDRNIIKGSKPIYQAMKLFSEFGELADNVGKGRDCRDDVGGVFVVLTIMAKQYGMSMCDMKPRQSEKKKTIKQHVSLLLVDFHEIVWLPSAIDFDDAVGTLKDIAELSGATLEECVQIAYNDIKDRKGILWNGVFVKESDLSYNACVEAYRESLSEKNTEN